jgi:hypothetical protein
MRYRFATTADLPTCQALLEPGFRVPPLLRNRLTESWVTLLTTGSGMLSVIEDPEVPHPGGLEAFAALVFVSDAFIDEVRAAPRPYLSAVIYERMQQDRSPVLTPAQIAAANARGTLNLVCLHFALRDRALDHPRTRGTLQVANTAFFFFVGGYRIQTLLQEVYGAEHAQYMRGGGLRLRCDFGHHFGGDPDRPPASDHPYLFGLDREEVEPAAVNPLSYLFHPLPPRFGFTRTAQRVLEQALLVQTDEEIAAHLRVSLDAVKQTWRAIYARVEGVAPRLLGVRPSSPEHHRSAERRRHLLDYLRMHLEELRPVAVERPARPHGAAP